MSGDVRGFRDLYAWQSSMDLGKGIHRLTQTFPDRKRFEPMSQFQRAATSVPSNSAEGQARRHTNDFIRYLANARGSSAEVETHLPMARCLDYVSEQAMNRYVAQSDDLGGQRTALRSAIECGVYKPKRLVDEPPSYA